MKRILNVGIAWLSVSAILAGGCADGGRGARADVSLDGATDAGDDGGDGGAEDAVLDDAGDVAGMDGLVGDAEDGADVGAGDVEADAVLDGSDGAGAADAADVSGDGEDGAGEEDGEQGEEPVSLFAPRSGVRIAERIFGGAPPTHGEVDVIFYDAPFSEEHYLEVNAKGACVFYRYEQGPPCEPACGWTAYCVNGTCEPAPGRIAAGVVTIEGLSVDVEVIPDETGFYTVQGALPADMFGPDSTIVVAAAGGDMEGFSRQVGGVGDMIADFTSLVLVDGQDNAIAWEVQGDDSTVELRVLTGWHGAPPSHVIWCSAPDEAGGLTIPRELVEAYPAAGGIGLFQHLSSIQRVKRVWVTNAQGQHEIAVSSEMQFSIEHNAGE